jgi:hypothetical protein
MTGIAAIFAAFAGAAHEILRRLIASSSSGLRAGVEERANRTPRAVFQLLPVPRAPDRTTAGVMTVKVKGFLIALGMLLLFGLAGSLDKTEAPASVAGNATQTASR